MPSCVTDFINPTKKRGSKNNKLSSNVLSSTFRTSNLWPQNKTIKVFILNTIKSSNIRFMKNKHNYSQVTNNRISPNNKFIDWEIESFFNNEQSTWNEYKKYDNVPKDDTNFNKFFNKGAKKDIGEIMKYIIKNRIEPIVNYNFDVRIGTRQEYEQLKHQYHITIDWGVRGQNFSYVGSYCKNKKPSTVVSEWSVETMTHEFLHALGQQHEHSNQNDKRKLNNQCVGVANTYISWIASSMKEKTTGSATDYDWKSVMNYFVPRWIYFEQDGTGCDCSPQQLKKLGVKSSDDNWSTCKAKLGTSRGDAFKKCTKDLDNISFDKINQSCPTNIQGFYENYVMSETDIAWLMFQYPPKEWVTLDDASKKAKCYKRAKLLWKYFYFPQNRTGPITNILGGTSTPTPVKPVKPVKPIQNCETRWGNWESCNQNTGRQRRTLQIIKEARNGGTACPTTRQEYQNCRVDCVGEWGNWGSCNQTTGKKQRILNISIQPRNGGTPCPSQTTENTNCPVNCTLKQINWLPWANCTKQSDGTFKQIRNPNISIQPRNGGGVCPNPQSRTCQPNCGTITYGNWSNCQMVNGKLQKTRTGTPSNSQCNKVTETVLCPINCKVSNWTNWSRCDINTGIQNKTRTITTQNKNGGVGCPSLKETKNCPINCVPEFNNFGACNKKTGTKTRTIKREQITSKNGGTKCAQSHTTSCPVDCEFTWNDWGQCTKQDDGTFKKHRTSKIIFSGKNGGRACPIKESQTCTPNIDCQFTWGNWGECGTNGKTTRNPNITKQSSGTGKVCPSTETKICVPNTDCQFTWGNWNKCGTNGKQKRIPITTKKPSGSGKVCPTEDIKNCPVNCITSSWGQWTKCDTNGKSYRTRTILTNPINGGKGCPSLKETKDCPVDCNFKWEKWSPCLKGKQIRNPIIISSAKNSGKSCPVTETKICPEKFKPKPKPPIKPKQSPLKKIITLIVIITILTTLGIISYISYTSYLKFIGN